MCAGWLAICASCALTSLPRPTASPIVRISATNNEPRTAARRFPLCIDVPLFNLPEIYRKPHIRFPSRQARRCELYAISLLGGSVIFPDVRTNIDGQRSRPLSFLSRLTKFNRESTNHGRVASLPAAMPMQGVVQRRLFLG